MISYSENPKQYMREIMRKYRKNKTFRDKENSLHRVREMKRKKEDPTYYEKLNKYHREWVKNNPDKVLRYERRRLK